MASKYLIINADDYGLDPDVNKAVLLLARGRMISSLTILANYTRPDDLAVLKEIPEVSKGLHVNLLEGKPLSGPLKIPSLVGEDGCFINQKLLLKKAFLKKINIADIKAEIKAQYQFLLDHNIEVTHCDSHKHIHQYPVIGPMILSILYELGIHKLRKCRPSSIFSKKMAVTKLFYYLTRKHLHRFVSPEILLTEFSDNPRFTANSFIRSLEKVFKKHETIEVMCHPSLANCEGSYLKKKAEYHLLKDENLKKKFEEKKIKMITFRDL